MNKMVVKWNGKIVNVADTDSTYYLGQILKKDMNNPDKRFGPVLVPKDECESIN